MAALRRGSLKRHAGPPAGVLKVGIVGAGLMGRNHARVVAESGARVVAVADPDPVGAAHVAERYGARRHAAHDALVRDPDVEAVVVATPTALHFAVARDALEAGKHVLVEKPMAATVDEARELVRLARKHGRTLAVGHVERHNPVVRWMKDKLASGAFGDVIAIQSRRLSPHPERVRDVGVVLDLGIHDLDVLCHLAGRSPAGVYALAGKHRGGPGLEDHASILADFAGGPKGFVELSWLTPNKVRTLSLTCSSGVVEGDYMDQSVTVSRSSFGRIDPDDLFRVPIEYSVERMTLRKEEPLKNEHLDFQAAIREARAPLVDGEAGATALALAQAALLSARTGARVPVTP
jgi:UDP-N-acetylglucosamine 3-dehydrogenase